MWSDSAYDEFAIFSITFPPQSSGRSAQAQYVSVLAVIIALSVLAALTRSLWAGKLHKVIENSCRNSRRRTTHRLPPNAPSCAVSGGARCANKMFTAMTSRVLRAPMSYFETTPLGRVINRFTYDVEVLDIELSVSMSGLMISTSWLVSSVIVMVSV